jgi:hypothetical protein
MRGDIGMLFTAERGKFLLRPGVNCRVQPHDGVFGRHFVIRKIHRPVFAQDRLEAVHGRCPGEVLNLPAGSLKLHVITTRSASSFT